MTTPTPNATPCPVEERLTPFLLGDLPAADAEAVRAHLAGCAPCRALAGELEATLGLLRPALQAAGGREVPAAFPPERLALVRAAAGRAAAAPAKTTAKAGTAAWWWPLKLNRARSGTPAAGTKKRSPARADLLVSLAVLGLVAIFLGLLLPATSLSRSKVRKVASSIEVNMLELKELPPAGPPLADEMFEMAPADGSQPYSGAGPAAAGGKMNAPAVTTTPAPSVPAPAAAPRPPRPSQLPRRHRLAGVTETQMGETEKGGAGPAAAGTAGEVAEVASAWRGGTGGGGRRLEEAAKKLARQDEVLFSLDSPRDKGGLADGRVAAEAGKDADSYGYTRLRKGVTDDKLEMAQEQKARLGLDDRAEAWALAAAAPAKPATAELAQMAAKMEATQEAEVVRREVPRELREAAAVTATDLAFAPAAAAAAAPPPAPPAAPQPALADFEAEEAPTVRPFVATAADAFSTFGIDVDTAAYSQARRDLAAGRLPAPAAVRAEEFINAFDYGYAPPAGEQGFAIHAESAPSPFRPGLELLKIGVKGAQLGRDHQQPAVLTLVVDGSGSMATPDRLGLVREALKLLLDRLRADDRVALVQFSDQPRLLLEPMPAAEKGRILAAVQAMQAGGPTHLENGLRLGYATAARGFVPGAANRVLLFTDGVANLGAADAASLLRAVADSRQQGIFLSVFGVGAGAYNDKLLEQFANQGDGTYTFLDSPAEARRALVEQFAATLFTIAKDVKIQVEFNPARVESWRQIGYDNRQLTREQFRDDTVDAGEVGAGQAATALYELVLKGSPREPLGVVRVRYREVASGAMHEIQQPLTGRERHPAFAKAPARFRLAAGVAEFAEQLRESPHVAGTGLAEVEAALRPVALELHLDGSVQELLRLVTTARRLKH
ncbi:MAG: von Willebrand factor type A domain-containing protein [Lentisphaeria bacterium]|jgi:Ca-activated chloride channel family protein